MLFDWKLSKIKAFTDRLYRIVKKMLDAIIGYLFVFASSGK